MGPTLSTNITGGGPEPQGPFDPEDAKIMCHNNEGWYRGKQTADEEGRYEFNATMAGEYPLRDIVHYHFKVTAMETEFVTQAYFRDLLDEDWKVNYVRGRDSQFPKVEAFEWGRTLTYNIRLPSELVLLMMMATLNVLQGLWK